MDAALSACFPLCRKNLLAASHKKSSLNSSMLSALLGSHVLLSILHFYETGVFGMFLMLRKHIIYGKIMSTSIIIQKLEAAK